MEVNSVWTSDSVDEVASLEVLDSSVEDTTSELLVDAVGKIDVVVYQDP